MQFRVNLTIALVLAVAGGIILLAAPSPLGRTAAGVALIFVLPGYLFLEVLWPNREGPDRLWRLTMILPTSIALVGALLLAINYLGTYDYKWTVILLVLLAVILAGLAFWRYQRADALVHHAGGRFLPLVEHVWSYQFNVWHGVLAFSCLILIGSIVYSAATLKKASPLSEFYVFTANGNLPILVNEIENSNMALKIGIVNHEEKAVDYRVMVMTQVQNTDIELWSGSVRVPDGATQEEVVNLPPLPQGAQSVQFLLIMQGNPVPYRSLRIAVKAP